jgi:DNA repair photolyase
MGLNVSKGNMYDFVTHTWNTIKGKCPHGCSYCYMKRWGQLKDVRFDKSELKTDLGSDNFIFVGSSCDIFAESIPEAWIKSTLAHCNIHNSRYLLQTKNPDRLANFAYMMDPDKYVLCTTIESNHNEKNNAPPVAERAYAMSILSEIYPTYVTIEPIMEFDLNELVSLIEKCKPAQVNIGADSGKNGLTEPSERGKVEALIDLLETFTIVNQKKNLKRLLNSE